GDGDALAEALQLMIDRRVDGILLGLMRARRIDVPELPAGLPLVVANGETDRGHDGFLPDEHAGGRAMARMLLDAGHRRIGVIGVIPAAIADPAVSVTIGRRFAGIEQAFAEAGVRPEIVEVADWDPDTGYAMTQRLLDAHPDLTAVLAANDSVAFGVYQALAERGLRIPGDLSVASFD